MPQASSITLSDGTNDHVFTPIGTNDKALFECRDSATSAGFETMILALDRAKTGRPTNKANLRLSQPIEMTADGVVTVRSTPRFIGDFVLPDDMTAAERLAFGNLAIAMLTNAVVKGYFTTLEVVW